jgi:hypothetical protein
LTKRQLLKDQTQFYPRGGRSLLRGFFKLWVGGNLTPQLFLLVENERDATEGFFIFFFLLLFHCHILTLSFYLFFIYFFGLLIFLIFLLDSSMATAQNERSRTMLASNLLLSKIMVFHVI